MRIINEPRQGLYILVILAGIIGASAYNLRNNTIFSCQASEYGHDRYLAYCHGKNYGDYDHGAIWFDLEPEANTAARDAEVLFLGNSRMQFAFSAALTDQWFTSHSISYYMLGFSHNESYKFVAPLLKTLSPQADVYILNIDHFFDPYSSLPAKSIMEDSGTMSRYKNKQIWQYFHKPICRVLGGICGNKIAFFRLRKTGMWHKTGGDFIGAPVTYNDNLDHDMIDTYTTAGEKFIPQLPVRKECVILTFVPKSGTSTTTPAAIANALGLNLIAPMLDGLHTFDGDHLDADSAERWSNAFLDLASPHILNCMKKS